MLAKLPEADPLMPYRYAPLDHHKLLTQLEELCQRWEREAEHLKSQVEQRLPIRDYLSAFLMGYQADQKQALALMLRDILKAQDGGRH